MRDRLVEHAPGSEIELVLIRTTGDRLADVPLSQVGGKGLFVKEIEEALLEERVDLAVHSVKDLPASLPKGLHLAAIPRREDPHDVLISKEGKRLADLPPGSRVGTSSLRRQAQLRRVRPDLEWTMLRGNLDTRLRKLTAPGLDAIVVASAGLHRMGWEDRVTEYLPAEICLPAIGQGALGIECRVGDDRINTLVGPLDDPLTRRAVAAERGVLARLQGDCRVPIAAYAREPAGEFCVEPKASNKVEPKASNLNESILVLDALVANPDGRSVVQARTLIGPGQDPEAVGRQLAERLLAGGAEALLRGVDA